jgi:septal ring factor EnvC (AmiA/AmiB activator)
LFILAILPGAVCAQDEDLTKIKEQELEEVRARINDLKESMDKSASNRDRVTGELQSAEVEMSEKRLRLKELERERDFSTRR